MNPSDIILQLHSFKIPYLLSICNQFNLPNNKNGKTKIKSRILDYLLQDINCGKNIKSLCDDIICKKCYYKSFLSNSKSLYWREGNVDKYGTKIKPRDVFLNSNVKYWFTCDKCNHDFDTRLGDVNTGKWCIYCCNHKLCDNNDCNFCYKKSFASSDKAQYWLLENNKDKLGNPIIPRQVFKSTGNKYWFNCDKCNHNFDIQLDSATKGNWCKYCVNQKLCDDECDMCYKKSFASSDKSKYWFSEKNKDKLGNPIIPRQVFKSSDNKYWFNCDKCNHNFDTRLSNITHNNRWCPYCSNQKICEDECIMCYNKSFASSDKVKYWVAKKNVDKYGNPINPRLVFKSTDNKYWFNCDKCNRDFDTRLSGINKGKWCRYCCNKTETLVLEHLSINYNCIHQPKFIWCKNKKNLPFDLLLPDYKLIIEIDGQQHFEVVTHWKTNVKLQQNKDKFKMKCALENGYTIIRLVQKEVFDNKIDWKSRLQQAIKIYDKPQVVFISDIPNIYDNHVFDINDNIEYNLIDELDQENINEDIIL